MFDSIFMRLIQSLAGGRYNLSYILVKNSKKKKRLNSKFVNKFYD